jgi:hypothetical protein
MRKRLVVMSVLILLTACQGYIVSDALAIPGEFETMWAMDLPRVTYFIGESVTFTVVAFASTDPTLMLPDQMAKITIRNDSLAEVYEAWITTNVNGSAPVTWDSGLEAVAGNYTIILDDLKGEKVVEHFMLLFNEETYWQVKVGLIEKELQSQYQYINFLYSFQKYQERKIKEMERRMTIFGALTFVTVMCAIYVGMHELSGAKRSTSGILSYGNAFKEVLGFRSRPIVELDHEEIASLHIPANKLPPIYGRTFYCQFCDKKQEHPMSGSELEAHGWAVHDRLHLKKDSIMAKLKEGKKQRIAKAQEKHKEPGEPVFASVEKYQQEWGEQTAKEHFQARLDQIKTLRKTGKLSDEKYQKMKNDLVADLDRYKQRTRTASPKPEVLKQTTSPKAEKSRKLREDLSISGILEKPVVRPAETSASKVIDELYERLNHEKVN